MSKEKEVELFNRLVNLKRELIVIDSDIKQLIDDFTISKENENGVLEKDVVKEIAKCADIKAKDLFSKIEEENVKRELLLEKFCELNNE